MTNPLVRRPPATLGIGAVGLGYLMLGLGFVCIGVASQQADIVVGLWLTEALAIALPAVIWLRASGAEIASGLGLRLPRARWFAIAAGTAILNQPVVSLLTYVAQSVLPHAMVVAFEQKNAGLDSFFSAHPISMLVAVAVAAPIGEEIFFRGFALPAAARSMPPLAAALVTAILFSAMHADPVGALGLFEIGFWLAVLRWGSGSLFPAMLGHALNNSVAGVWFMLGLQTAGRTPPQWAISMGIENPDAPPPTWVLALGAALALAGAALAARVLSQPRPEAPSDALSEAESAQPAHRMSQLRAWPLWTIWVAALIAGAAQLLRSSPR